MAWIAAGGALCGAFLVVWNANPALSYATGGERYPRVGITTAILIIPLILSSVRLAKTRDPGSATHWVIPLLLAIGLFLLGAFVGFNPDLQGCAGIARFGPLPAGCTTSSQVRGEVLMELGALWVLFGVLTVAFTRLRARRDRRRNEPELA